VFGRGGEEVLALQQAKIPYEVVPGISSAIAIPAAAGIPVTHRGISRSFHVITGHTAEDTLPAHLAQLARLEGTLVFLMGLRQLPSIARGLMEGGMSPDTPAAVLSGGNSPNPASVRGTLSNIAEKAVGVSPPAVIVVGQTAALDLSPS
jgi:uroporphyrinogen III methyltransferase/synthase